MTRTKTRRPAVPALIEAVEPRTLMSDTVSPGAVYLRPSVASAAAVSTSITGYTPAEIRTAYGFDAASFSNGAVAANGAGQTIAIVDAFNDPNIRADLGVFDAQFGIAGPSSFDVVNQTGGTNLPATDADWAGEIALDVEWAHAIAPGASLLLVEAASDSTTDLMTAVNYARAAAGVSVVSMSWGGSEYVSWGQGGESATQTSYDGDFTTPAGHRGVTFVAAAGDSGQQSGVQWPASSANVLSVGGTTLSTADDGTYLAETGWSGTSSGYSQVEPEPAFQQAVQQTGSRSVADVAYDGDPNSGFAVYDSLADSTGSSGWQEVGGTSAGSPQWAGLIAVANQGRSVAGLTALDGVSQTLPDLYALYTATGSTGYATYFNDVTSGGSGTYGGGHHGPAGSSSHNAAAGYDVVTGLGTPKAAAIIDGLATAAAVTGGSGPTTGTGGTTGGGTTTSTATLSPVAVSILTTPTPNVVGGSAAAVRVRLANTGSTVFSGPVTVTLSTSTDATTAGVDGTVATVTLKGLKLRAGGARTLTIKFAYPRDVATGTYFLVATASATATTTQATFAASAAVTVTAPSVDLAVAFANTTAVAITPGKKARATIRLTNAGNVVATGTVTVTLTAVGTADGSRVQVTIPVTRKLKLAAGRTLGVTLAFTAPASMAAGSYTLVASIASATTPADANAADDTAATSTTPA